MPRPSSEGRTSGIGDGSGAPRRTQDHFLEGKPEGGARALLTLHRTGGRGENRRAFARALWIGSKRPRTRHRALRGRRDTGLGRDACEGAIPACCSRILGGRALLPLFGV